MIRHMGGRGCRLLAGRPIREAADGAREAASTQPQARNGWQASDVFVRAHSAVGGLLQGSFLCKRRERMGLGPS